jgi:hypothetical protein
MSSAETRVKSLAAQPADPSEHEDAKLGQRPDLGGDSDELVAAKVELLEAHECRHAGVHGAQTVGRHQQRLERGELEELGRQLLRAAGGDSGRL